MHFGRCGRITAGARNPVGSSPGVTAGYSPEGEEGEEGRGEGEGEGGGRRRGRLGSLVCTVAQSLASVLLLARILIDFENTIFCANDQNAALAARCYSDPVLTALCLVPPRVSTSSARL